SKAKYIFVTGGVMSGLGKGITTASLAKLLQLCGLKVSCIKIDPYLNYDAGTMNPITHGEVFVTNDGGECDMDIGTYERFLDLNLTKDHNITTAQIYAKVMESERKGEYLGQCVQIIPHITEEIKNRIRSTAKHDNVDLLVVECGGTVGDIESLPFLEAMRQMRMQEGTDKTLFVHVTLAPILDVVGEIKTKPTQHSVQELRRIGIQPDIITIRSKVPLDASARRKISLFTNVEEKAVISSYDTTSIYTVLQILEEQGLHITVIRKLNLDTEPFRWGDWLEVLNSYSDCKDDVKIAMVGKYVNLADSYVSVNQALSHAGAKLGYEVNIDFMDSEQLENGNLQSLDNCDGILIPGGFGERGSEGIINTANYARVKNIPYLGICFGFQLAVVAFARHVCNLSNANSTEINPNTEDPVIDLLPEQNGIDNMGGTMRLGAHEIDVQPNTIAHELYGSTKIAKRHRHRYEFNQEYRGQFEKLGMIFSGASDGHKRMEILEVPNHTFYFAVQYHAEFTGRPGKPEEAFLSFMAAAIKNKKIRT
ncbi:MAG: CTP synthase, partial [Nitrososphaerales archaeon]